MALARQNPAGPKPQDYDDYLIWAVIAVLLGGRSFYILFYNLSDYLARPADMLKLWHGGMSFHGGMTGVIVAAWLFARSRKIPFLAFTDLLACVAPIGLFLGRLANFVNGELFGRVTDVAWGVVFPRGGDLPRHPSQLYESATEGLLLLFVMYLMSRSPSIRTRPGLMSGTFLALYGAFRFAVEFFREPDAQLGFLFAGATMGQLLCLPMILLGLFIILYARRRHEPA
jgi:phosphatidylglycerol:prolipoprotein diacylglycerol transferase